MLVGNGVFVAFGWLVYQAPRSSRGVQITRLGYFIAGFIGHGVYLYLGFLKGSTRVVMFMLDPIGSQVDADAVERSAQILTTACLALTVYLLVLASSGSFCATLRAKTPTGAT